MNETPKPGERWHFPDGATTDNPVARSVVIVAIVEDEHIEDPHTGGPLRLVLYRQWFKHKRRWHHDIEHAWLWRESRGWARGPLPRGTR